MATEIYFLDGFDQLEYGQTKNEGKYLNIGYFDQGSIIPGREAELNKGGGLAMRVFNSGGYAAGSTKVLTARNRYVVGFAWRADFHFVDSILMRWESLATPTPIATNRFGTNPGVEFAVRLRTDGLWQFYTGGDGTNSNLGTSIGITPTAFNISTWYYIELDVKFGVGGWIKMYVNDVLFYSSTSLTVGHHDPDRWTWRWEGFGNDGITLDDLYIANDRLGPCRITSAFTIGPGPFTQWTNFGHWFPSATPINWESVSDHAFSHGPSSHDFDSSYVTAAHTTHPIDYYKFQPMPCYGRILAVAVNATGRNGLLINAPGVDLMLRAKPTSLTETIVAAGQLWKADHTYGIVQGLLQLNPANADTWVEKALNDTYWGIRAAGVGTSRVTQVFLEKLVTLRDVPFNCGKSSYAFGKS